MKKRKFMIWLSILLGILFCALVLPRNGQNKGGNCIGLRDQSCEIYVNGKTRTIEAPPYLYHNIMFVPYDSIASILGGAISYSDQTDAISSQFPKTGTMHSNISIKFELNTPDLLVNDKSCKTPGLLMDSAGGDISVYKAYRRNCIIYVPIDYFQRAEIAEVWQMPNSDSATISNLNEHLGANPFYLEENFYDLDAKTQKEFFAKGTPEFVAQNDMRQTYTNGHVDLFLSETTGNTKQLIIKGITLKDDFYATDRGLRVGDSISKYEYLYAGNNFGTAMDVITTNGDVSQISFWSYS